ncbi:MAG: DUF4249 domain-containing protein [Rhodothermales bacterium]
MSLSSRTSRVPPNQRTGSSGAAVFVVVTTSLLGLQGCKGFIDVDLPQRDPELAVFAFASPHDELHVDVFRVASAGEAATIESLRINDATVVFSRGDMVDTLSLSADGGYVANVRPTYSERFEIRVVAPGYPAATAASAIPDRPSISGVDVSAVRNDEEWIDYGVSFTLDDMPGPTVYSVGAYTQRPPNEQTQGVEWTGVFLTGTDPVFRTELADVGALQLEVTIPSGSPLYLSDATFDGERTDLAVETRLYFRQPPLEARLVVTAMDADYFEYHKALELQRRNLEDPFAEPVALYSNVIGGQGVVAGYAREETSIVFQ